MTFEDFSLIRLGKSDDPEYGAKDGKPSPFFGKEFLIETKAAVHRSYSGNIIICVPGFNGSHMGYDEKYLEIGDYVQNEIGSFLRYENMDRRGFIYENFLQDELRFMIKYALENSVEICGKKDPHIFLMGYSAGAGAVAAVAEEFSEIEKILLLSPAGNAGQDAIVDGLSRFKGEVYVVIGENDEIVGSQTAQHFYDAAKAASKKEIRFIEDCDHQWTGEKNGKLLSRTPFWAFAGDASFPDPGHGIILYK